jgi:hypothetical protein
MGEAKQMMGTKQQGEYRNITPQEIGNAIVAWS